MAQPATGQRKARAELRRAAEIDRRNLADQYRAARALQIAGDAGASLVYIERLTGIDPDYRDTQFLLGWALQSAGRAKPAIAAYRRFLGANPDHAQARFNLGFALKETGDCRAAVAQFVRVAGARRRNEVGPRPPRRLLSGAGRWGQGGGAPSDL